MPTVQYHPAGQQSVDLQVPDAEACRAEALDAAEICDPLMLELSRRPGALPTRSRA